MRAQSEQYGHVLCVFSFCQTSWAANLIAIVDEVAHIRKCICKQAWAGTAARAEARPGADMYALVRDRMYLSDTFVAATEINTC